ncbi:hypothetical protein MHC_02325 [Mycoplasma haemocanis str. Illinois]|uniref:Uncharacterized protein n=1 Tax=Mycoplasma haemocanis (strain Illinois) TaxID=1111676 RepID=H6N6Q9_MYCHN|nr:hypothetical protein [Mycoplasma haemocanis]AEW45331.1 hypothetical protein MHC_02325 [Mycoplasma haemocanis str. Illinois]
MPSKISLFPSNLRVGLMVGAASLASVGTSSGLLLDANRDNLKTIADSAGTAAAPIVGPIKQGKEQLSQQLDEFSKKGYNLGIDAKGWVSNNFNKVKIKSGAIQIYNNLKSGYDAVSSFAKEAKTTIKDFFENWESKRETMHIVFKSIGNSFSILGGLVSSSSAGESKIKVLFEVLANEKFKDFVGAVGNLTSKNPSLLSQLKGDDVYDVLNAFKQAPEEVVGIINKLVEDHKDKPQDSVTRDVFISALKLQSLMGKAQSILANAKKLLQDKEKNKDAIEKATKELEATIKELTNLIKSQESEGSSSSSSS